MAVSDADGSSLFDEHQSFTVTVDGLQTSRQYYVPNTNVLVTEMRNQAGVVEVTDAFTLCTSADLSEDVPAVRSELLRYVRVLEGHALLRVSVEPDGVFRTERHGGGLRFHRYASGNDLRLITSRPLDHPSATVSVEAGEDLWFLLRWHHSPRIHRLYPRHLLDETADAWRRWTGAITYDGPYQHLVRRSALTLKLLGHTDSPLAASALRDLGLFTESDHVLGRALDTLEVGEPRGRYGYFLDCAYQWALNRGPIDDVLWNRLAALANAAAQGPQPTITYTTAMYQVALDRAARLSDHLGIAGHRDWHAKADDLRDRILREAWDESRQSLTARLSPGADLDPRLLALPSLGVVPVDHPRMAATANAIAKELSAAPGLVFEPSRQAHGATLTYGFQLAENLAGQGQLDQANQLFEELTAKANPLGLFGERVEVSNGEFRGSFPNPATHAAVVACASALA